MRTRQIRVAWSKALLTRLIIARGLSHVACRVGGNYTRETDGRPDMKRIITIALIAFCFSACSSRGAVTRSAPPNGATRLTDEEKHRLYSAALAASESPLDNDAFKEVCQRIGICDSNGQPNDQYMAFVSRHVDWATKSETDDFRREINSKEKAREYIRQHLSAR